MERRGRLSLGPEAHLPPFPVAVHHPRDEGLLCPTQPSRHSFMVVVDGDGEEVWIVDPLCLQPTNALATALGYRDNIIHAITATWAITIVQQANCVHLAVRAASSFVYRCPQDWKNPKRGDLFDRNKPMPKHHGEEQNATVEWLQQ